MVKPPNALFKYLPGEYVAKFLERGDLLFRNLSYFRQIEDQGRSDLLEGLHMDYPDNDITLETTDGRVRWQGQAAFLNSVNPDRILIFCLSETLSQDLAVEFRSDACVEIRDVPEFLQRCERVVSRQPRFAESGLLHGPVEYYEPNKPAHGNVKDPKNIPFFKHIYYRNQVEYRLALALTRGLKLTQRIVNESFSFEEEVSQGVPAHRHVFVGPLSDIARVRRF